MSRERLTEKHKEYDHARQNLQLELCSLLERRAGLEAEIQGLDGRISTVRRTLHQNEGAAEAIATELKVPEESSKDKGKNDVNNDS